VAVIVTEDQRLRGVIRYHTSFASSIITIFTLRVFPIVIIFIITDHSIYSSINESSPSSSQLLGYDYCLVRALPPTAVNQMLPRKVIAGCWEEEECRPI